MRYYKIIKDNAIVGVVTDDDFILYNINTSLFCKTTKERGQYVQYKGKLYRDYWFQPTILDTITYIQADIQEITEEEYNILNNIEEPVSVNIEEPNYPSYELPVEEQENNITLEYVRSSKINEMSVICNQVIEAGFDIELGGEAKHFSLTTQDQLNLISLKGMVDSGVTSIPYHADGEICQFYSAANMEAIITAATGFKIYHTTYYNALKNYINSLDTIEDIAAITYGVELPEEYQSDVLKTLL